MNNALSKQVVIHNLFPPEFHCSWASDWGEDKVGLWMAFEYKNARQALRWISPGAVHDGFP
jgi:sulfatase modifying factor 1